MKHSIEQKRIIDDLCNQFEENWTPDDSGAILRIGQNAAPELQNDLLRALIEIDIELRQKSNLVVDPDSYSSLDPQAVTWAIQVIDQSGLDRATLPVTPNVENLESAESTFGPYRISRILGEGGMGAVWLAEQEQPVKRRVALKLIRSGIGSKETIARFEAERQALAMMDHPNIAKILDAGMSSDGRPFFAMELVDGIPITDYCDENKLSPDDRLELFVSVCSAVQHAHQKGIIHRDLKPSNILITEQDGKAVPKVIDFGLAKALEQDLKLTDKTVFTEFGQVVGTLQYMSPEQAESNQQAIDTRTDIYALGVVLYELLTGSTPLEVRYLKENPLLKVLEQIREMDPPRPSFRLGDSGDDVIGISARRKIDPRKLEHILRGELDWIVMKALEKEPARRYETASDFGMDIGRYLNREAVMARPPSASYRLGKLIRKNIAAVTASAIILFLLVAGVIGTSSGMYWALTQKKMAEGLALKEKAANEKAQRRLGHLQKSNEILGLVFQNLSPEVVARSKRPLQDFLRENLIKAAERIEDQSIGSPLVVAQMQDTLGTSLTGLGDYQEATTLLKKAISTFSTENGENHETTLNAMFHLALCYRLGGKYEDAIQLHQTTFEKRQQVWGNDHLDTLDSMKELAKAYQSGGQFAESVKLNQEVHGLLESRYGADHPQTLEALANLASVLGSVGNHSEAIKLYQTVLDIRKDKLGEDHLDTVFAAASLAGAFLKAKRFAEALEVQKQVLKDYRRIVGPTHPATLACLNNLAEIYRNKGNLEEAIRANLELLKLKREELGPEHPNTLVTMNNLALAYSSNGQIDKAIETHEAEIKISKKVLGLDHPNVLLSMDNLGIAYRKGNRFDDAIVTHEEVLNRRKKVLGPTNRATLDSMGSLATDYQSRNRLDEAIELNKRLLALRKAEFGEEDSDTLVSMSNLAENYRRAERLEESFDLNEQVLEIRKRTLGLTHPDTMTNMANLGVAYVQAKRLDDATKMLVRTLELRKKHLGPDHPLTHTSYNHLAVCYFRSAEYQKAANIFEQKLAFSVKKHGTRHATTILDRGNLATACERAGELERAAKNYKENYDCGHARSGNKLLSVLVKLKSKSKLIEHVKSLETDARKSLSSEDMKLQDRLVELGNSLLQGNAASPAQLLFEEVLEIRKSKQLNDWQTNNVKSLLGASLLAQQQFGAAERLLTESAEHLLENQEDVPNEFKYKVTDAVSRTIDLYDLWNQSEPNPTRKSLGNEWKAKLDEWNNELTRDKAGHADD